MRDFFSWRNLMLLNGLFWLGIILLHIVVRLLAKSLAYTMVGFWPINVMELRIPTWQDWLGVLLIGVFWIGFLRIWAQRKTISLVLLLGGTLMMMTNLLQGYREGLAYLITGGSQFSVAYWNDAAKVQSTRHLLTSFELFQPNMLDHSRVHPPGALLLVYWFRMYFVYPEVLSIFWAFCGWATGILIYLVSCRYLRKSLAVLLTLLFYLLPGIQIYSLATLDAVVMLLFAGTIWSWLKHLDQLNLSRSNYGFLGMTIGLWWWATFINYASWILLPTIVVMEWMMTKKIRWSIMVLLIMGILYWILWKQFGFDYGRSLMVAKSFEGPGGSGSHQWGAFVVTRIQAILELLIFLTPTFLILLVNKRFKRWLIDLVAKLDKSIKSRKLASVTGLEAFFATQIWLIMSFVGFLVLGAYYAGETGRAALYLYPSIVWLAGFSLKQFKLNHTQEIRLMSAILGQTVLMQLYGWYVW